MCIRDSSYPPLSSPLSPLSSPLSHLSSLISHLSSLISHLSSLTSHASCLTSHVSRFMSHVSCPMSHVSCATMPHSWCGRVPAFSGGPRGRLKPHRPVYKIFTCCQINVNQISLRNTHISAERVGIRVPCPAAVNAAHQPPQTSGTLEQPQIGPAHMSAPRRHAALWKMLHADGINDPPAGPAC